MLLVQEYLLTHSLVELETEHAVKARVKGYKASFNYDQIEAQDSNLLAQQCRGLVLRTKDGTPFSDKAAGETVVLARPFDRFFNQGQGAAAPVNLESPETAIFEKLDGTLIILHFDDIQGRWHVATRAVCEADLPVSNWEIFTFRKLFEKALFDTLPDDIIRKLGESKDLPEFLDDPRISTEEYRAAIFDAWCETSLLKELTYMFELCTPYNQVVVVHQKCEVTLLGCRHTQSGAEYWPHEIGPALNVPHVIRHRFGHPDEMLEFVRERDPKMFEGIVACEEYEPFKFRRVKIKNAQYLAYSRLKDSIASPRNVMLLILGGNLDDAFVVMPDEIKERSILLQEGIRQLFKEYNQQYTELLARVSLLAGEHPHGSKEHRKVFALTAKSSGIWFEPAMMQYTGKCTSANDFVEKKRDVDGSYPSSFLDYLIQKAEEKVKLSPSG